jgi:hypothetical protein
MKNNPKDAVLKFLGEEFVIKLKENNDLILNKVLESCTIEATKSTVKYDILVRNGVVGDCKNHFNKTESDFG